MENVYPVLFIIFGIVGVILGINRALKKEEEESRPLMWIGGISSFLLFGLLIFILLNGVHITKYNILFTFLYTVSLIARPLKKIPFAFLAAAFIGMGLFYLVISNMDDYTFLGAISLKYIVIAIIVLVILVFIIGLVQEKAMDAFLFIWSWGPIITILGLAMVVEGITLLINYPNEDGIYAFLPH